MHIILGSLLLIAAKPTQSAAQTASHVGSYQWWKTLSTREKDQAIAVAVLAIQNATTGGYIDGRESAVFQLLAAAKDSPDVLAAINHIEMTQQLPILSWRDTPGAYRLQIDRFFRVNASHRKSNDIISLLYCLSNTAKKGHACPERASPWRNIDR